MDETLTRIVLNGGSANLSEWKKILEANKQIKNLTVIGNNQDVKMEEMDFGKPYYPFERIWEQVETFTCIDSFVHFNFGYMGNYISRGEYFTDLYWNPAILNLCHA
ncbi:hypothetical protein RvY_15305 [Ramazzottius varieornatus]|uniref:Uncharacterized protein n=1 Tax=Ramazzottius varieornatus TaxID=947166 RepID=A0A1D1W2I6_RAMVA|nr:hypothetical protein RvY_15305 [Ramazzottius varieornatus]